jgi:hypothetical protein
MLHCFAVIKTTGKVHTCIYSLTYVPRLISYLLMTEYVAAMHQEDITHIRVKAPGVLNLQYCRNNMNLVSLLTEL